MHRKICSFIAVMSFVILSAGCAFGDVAIDEEHFPDPTFRAYVMMRFDKDSNGILNDDEIASVTGIYLSDWRWKWDDPYDHIWYVKSLKGIEYLTALKQIDCSDNGLTQLDVSKNIMLQYLNCIGSRLTTLNIGSHPTLKTLLCENNLLSSINIGNCPALIELYCKDNRLSSLNVSSCPALTRLDCSCNRLVSLNLCKSAFFERFNCSYNKIQELDVRTNRFDGDNGGMYISTNDINGHDFTRVYSGKSGLKVYITMYGLEIKQASDGEYFIDLNDYVPDATSGVFTAYFAGTQFRLNSFWHYFNLGLDKPADGIVHIGKDDDYYIGYSGEYLSGGLGDYMRRTAGYRSVQFDYTMNYGDDENEGYYKIGLCEEEPPEDKEYNNPPVAPVPVNIQFGVIEGNSAGDKIIRDVRDSHYIDKNGNELTEESIANYSVSEYGKSGFAADGNSRLIVRVKSDKPGYALFSLRDADGVILESMTDRSGIISNGDYSVQATKISGGYQASVVLVAPESFPAGKEFPYDTFKIRVIFIAEDEETQEGKYYNGKGITDDGSVYGRYDIDSFRYVVADIKTIELKLEAAPVILIPGMFDNPANTFAGVRSMLRANKFDNEHIDVWDYGFYENPLNRMSINNNDLFKKLTAMFKRYAEKGIVCTKADIVAYGMGGLLAEKYLSDGDKDSNDGNNWSVRSYKQGMVRRLITVATPHYGTPWADILTGATEAPIFDGSSTSASSIVDTWNFAYKYWMDDESIFSQLKSVLYDLKTTRENHLPADVPMHVIYGDVRGTHGKIQKLLEAGDRIFSDVLAGTTILGAAITSDKRAAIVFAAITLSVHCLHDILDGIDVGIDNVTFKGQAHDRVVSSQSAAGGLTGAVSGFSGEWRYRHSTICKQPEVASKIVLLLQGDLSNFEEMNASRSTVSGAPSKAEVSKLSSAAESFRFIEAINLNISPAVLNITGDSTKSSAFTVTSSASMNEDIYCVFDDGSESAIFVIESSDRQDGKFEVKLKFTSQDAGAIRVFCFSNNPNDKDGTSIYVSNTACMTVLADIDNLDSANIVSIDFSEGSTVYANVNSETPAGLYAVDSDGRYYDVSSPLAGTQWTSTEFARVNDNGCILGLKEGTATLTATFRGITASVNVEVSAAIEDDTQEETPPEILTETLSSALTGQTYSLQLKASGTTPITWTHTGKLPAGLSLSESGLISGTPTKAGKSSFTVTAQNSYGKTSKSFTIQTFDPVSITTSSLKAGTIGKSYNATMKTKGTKVITWSAEGLPNGLSINAKGKISGKPSEYGVFNVKLKAENGAGITEKTLQLTVKAIAPTLSGTLAKPTLNVPYSSGLKLSKGSTPVTWSVEGKLPVGLSLDSSTGIISGTPASYDKSGFKFTITASNDAGRKSKNITLKVKGIAPKITAKLPQATAGENYSAELSATGSEPITFAAELPEYLTLDGSTINGTVPDSVKSFKITAYASNPVKKNVKKSYTIKASAKESLPQNQNADNDTDITEISGGINSRIDGGVPSFTENIVRLYSESYVIVAELGEVSCDMAGLYDFNVEIPDCIPEGSELVYISNSDEPSSDDEIAEFFNEEGNEISKVPESRKISVSIWLNPERIYKPVIAVKK